jgi:hypothetical protein
MNNMLMVKLPWGILTIPLFSLCGDSFICIANEIYFMPTFSHCFPLIECSQKTTHPVQEGKPAWWKVKPCQTIHIVIMYVMTWRRASTTLDRQDGDKIFSPEAPDGSYRITPLWSRLGAPLTIGEKFMAQKAKKWSSRLPVHYQNIWWG